MGRATKREPEDWSFLNGWRKVVTSARGPQPSTRFVLTILATYSDPEGNVSFTTQEKLAERTGLSVRTVQRCLDYAARTGWIERDLMERNGTPRKWALYSYCLTMPPELHDTVSPRQHVQMPQQTRPNDTMAQPSDNGDKTSRQAQHDLASESRISTLRGLEERVLREAHTAPALCVPPLGEKTKAKKEQEASEWIKRTAGHIGTDSHNDLMRQSIGLHGLAACHALLNRLVVEKGSFPAAEEFAEALRAMPVLTTDAA